MKTAWCIIKTLVDYREGIIPPLFPLQENVYSCSSKNTPPSSLLSPLVFPRPGHQKFLSRQQQGWGGEGEGTVKNDAGGGRGEQGGMSTVDQDAKFTKTFPEKDGGVGG